MTRGFDPNHITFYKAPDYTETRVKLIVEFDASGKEVKRWDTPEAIKAYTTEDEENPGTHGTHVLGIMSEHSPAKDSSLIMTIMRKIPSRAETTAILKDAANA